MDILINIHSPAHTHTQTNTQTHLEEDQITDKS